MPGETGPAAPPRAPGADPSGAAGSPKPGSPGAPEGDAPALRTRRDIREGREAERRAAGVESAPTETVASGTAAYRPAVEQSGARQEGERAPTGVRTSRVVLRRVDPWAVMKISLLFYLSMFVVLLVAGILLWLGARSAGVIGNVESFMDEIGFTDFEFVPGQILRGSAIAGLVLVVAGTFGNILMSVLYNLIADVLGGFKITLAEDHPPSRRI